MRGGTGQDRQLDIEESAENEDENNEGGIFQSYCKPGYTGSSGDNDLDCANLVISNSSCIRFPGFNGEFFLVTKTNSSASFNGEKK